MYVPKINAMGDMAVMAQFIEKNGFATLVSCQQNRPFATHLPLQLTATAEGWRLQGHVSRANPHAALLMPESTVLAIFTGAHAYISSSWYEKENVSTWNYSAVHVYGQVRLLSEVELLASVTALTAHYEAQSRQPLLVEKMSPQAVQKELKGIVGFEILVTEVEGKAKLSQNRQDRDFAAIVHELEQSTDGLAQEVAKDMKKIRPL